MRLPLVAGLVALSVAWGCGAGREAAGGDRPLRVDGRTFVEVVAALRRAARHAPDASAFERRKSEILARHAVRPEDLAAFVEAASRDPEWLASLWDSIDARLAAPPPPSPGQAAQR